MLYRDLTARENLEFFGKLYAVADPRRRAEELLAAVDLLDRADDAVGGFSRGMAQRVSIARALVHDPELILADEPFTGLDAPSTRSIELLLGRLHQLGKTVLLVNHDIEQSLRLVQRVIVLHKGGVVMDQPAGAVDGARILELVSAT
jgi:heme exporter protein A